MAQDPPAQGGGDPAYKMASLAAATGVLFAIVGRADADDVGAHLDISIQEAVVMATLQTSNANIYVLDGRIPARRDVSPVYECGDGGWVGLNPRPDRFGRLLEWFREEGIETALRESDWELARGVGYGSQLGIRELIAEVAAAHPRDEMVRRAQAFGQLCLPVLRLEEMQAQEHFRVNEQFLEVDHDQFGRSLGFVRSPVDAMDGEVMIRRAPLLGEHNAEVYAGLGLSGREISDLDAVGAI
jgi:crotonobetainyl-CoA:carnitine CoA-transferase CaiB-like acyl-CoA transferase